MTNRRFHAFVAALVLTPAAWAANITWEGSETPELEELEELNWTNADNWSGEVAPGAIDNVTFDDTGAADTAGTITSVVDTDFTINSLHFKNTTGSFHTIEIPEGVTLTTAGFTSNIGGSTTNTTRVDFTGGGNFVFNNAGADMLIGVNHTSGIGQGTTVNMSQLASVTITANRLDVGRVTANGSETFRLGANNVITADAVRMGAPNGTSTLELGDSNQINTGLLEVATAAGNGSGNLSFWSGVGEDATVTIRGKAGGDTRANLSAGFAVGNADNVTATIDFSAGTVDALLNTVILGQNFSSANTRRGIATLTFDAGTIDIVTATLGNGLATTQNNSNSRATGTINVNGAATLVVGTLRLGSQLGVVRSEGIVNLSGDDAVLRVAAITPGSTSGTGPTLRQVNFTNGTIGNKLGGDMTIAPEIALRLVNGGTHRFDIESGRTGTIHANITQTSAGQGIVKTGEGTLVLNGNNTYTGLTLVDEGVVLVNGSITGGAVVNGGMLAGSGTVGGTTTVNGGGVLGGTGTYDVVTGSGLVSPGNSPGVVTSTSVDVSAGLDFAFEFTTPIPGAPDYGTPGSSLNDVYRLTSATPFVGGPLDGDNTISVYFNFVPTAQGMIYEGGFFTDQAVDFIAEVLGADYQFFKLDPLGSTVFEGVNYSAIPSYWSVNLWTAPQTADFGSGGVSGRVMQFQLFVPEPATALLVLAGTVLIGRTRSAHRRG